MLACFSGVSTDLLPTFLEVAGVELPDGLDLDGISLVEELLGWVKEGDTADYAIRRPHEDTLFWGQCQLSPPDKQGAIVKEGRYKILFDKSDIPTAVYDLDRDPFEDNNLLKVTPLPTEVGDLVKEMTTRWKAYIEEPRLQEKYRGKT